MYINTFKYTPADVDCKLCTEYVKKFGCTACGCPWMAERIEAGVVGYAEVVRQMFPHDKRLMARLEPLIRDFPGMLWQDERHRQRMEGVKIHLGHSKRRDTPAFFVPSPGRRKSIRAAARMAFWLSCRCHAPWLGAHLKPLLFSSCR